MPNEPLILAIDPGRHTGYALVGLNTENIIEVGLLDRGEPYYKERIKTLIRRADYLAIEAQYIADGRKGGLRVSMQNVQRIIEAKQEVITLWSEIHPDGNNTPIQFQPRQWQCAIGIKAKYSYEIKLASMKIASLFTHRNIASPDMADAVNIGKYAVGQIRAAELKLKAVEGR